MRLMKCMAVIVTIVFGSAPTPTLAQIAQGQAALTFNMPPLDVTKGQAFAWSLCTNTEVPADGQGATGGLACNEPNAAVQGGCPPYKFRLADARDPLSASASLNKFLPPGVFLEPNGVIHGTVKTIGVLTRSGGVICVEDSCNSTPSCRQLELQPVNPDTRTLTSEQARLVQSADVSAVGKSASPDARRSPSADPGSAAPPASGAPQAGAASKGKGGAVGKVALVALGVTAAGIGVAMAANAASTTSTGDSCPTRTQCCGSGGAGGGCGIPAQCACPSPTWSGGICSSGGCLNFVRPGDRVCNGC